MVEVAAIWAVVNVAKPPTGFGPPGVSIIGIATTGALPSEVVAAKNVTVPVGAFPKLPVPTVATNVKFVFAATLVGNVVIAALVGAWVIVNGTPTEVLAL